LTPLTRAADTAVYLTSYKTREQPDAKCALVKDFRKIFDEIMKFRICYGIVSGRAVQFNALT